ncbi:MAG: nucleotidyltransferase domain-containing protein [Actinomycetota bacterium]|nr:nucleotidyltransferase domain-containing protein [Actinomycetota bacterium]
MFTIGDRDRVRDRVLELASSDPRVVAGAAVGSLAHDEGDRWSDLDLMFAVADDVAVPDVLESWTETIIGEFGAVRLFDLPSGPIIYRVFLLPDSLELDLSFVPASEFGAGGPRFRLLFGEAADKPYTTSPPADELFGYAVHHALHARTCIERGRYRQAEYWISAVRDHALALACHSRGLDGAYGRDFDRLPAEILGSAEDALVRSFEPRELKRALGSAVDALLRESTEVEEMAGKVEDQLREAASGLAD